MTDLCALMDRKVNELRNPTPNPDPAIAPWAQQVTTAVRRAQAFEGVLIAHAIPAVLARAPHLNVVAQPRICLPQRALEAIAEGVEDIALEYTEDGSAHRRLDFAVFDARSGALEFVECKRGLHQIGADHQRARLNDDAVLELIGRSYARKKFRQIATDCRCVTVSYYGNTGLPENRTVRASELDAHYGWPVRNQVEKTLTRFRTRLDQAIPGLTGAT